MKINETKSTGGTMFQAGDVIRARNPQTRESELGTVVKFTSHRWLHVQFSTGVYRIHPDEVTKEEA